MRSLHNKSSAITAGKPYQFKAPPRLNNVFPLLMSYGIELRSSKIQTLESAKKLHIDLSHVEELDALGLAIFAANLAKEVRRHSRFEFQIGYPLDKDIENVLREIQVENLFIRLGLDASPMLDLWANETSLPDRAEPFFVTFDNGRQAILYIPKGTPASGRTSLIYARRHLKNFYARNPSESINYKQFHHILDEIIKNSIDHSGDVGLTAIKYVPNSSGDKLYFAHCELGDGIYFNVSNFLKNSDDEKLRRLGERNSITECLHWAFLPGNTSKPNSGVNAGLGLPHLRSASHGGNIEVYFKDARSIAYVSDFPEVYSHKQIRRRLYHTHSIPCFMYFGETR